MSAPRAVAVAIQKDGGVVHLTKHPNASRVALCGRSMSLKTSGNSLSVFDDAGTAKILASDFGPSYQGQVCVRCRKLDGHAPATVEGAKAAVAAHFAEIDAKRAAVSA